MRHGPDNFEEIAHAFPSHRLQLDIALDASDIWQATAFCAAELSKADIAPDRISHQSGGHLSLRIVCANSHDIAQVKRCFRSASAPKVLRWTTTIGRVISPAVKNTA